MKLPLPSPNTLPSTLKLFITGSTIGPIVDSLHNQCLLEYDRAPINIPMPSSSSSTTMAIAGLDSTKHQITAMMSDAVDVSTATATATISTALQQPSYLFCSSWYIPLLLGVAYVVLGDILPNGIHYLLQKINGNKDNMTMTKKSSRTDNSDDTSIISSSSSSPNPLRYKAILAVTTTAMIIKLSDFLQTHNDDANALISFIITNTNPEAVDTSAINLGIMIMTALTQWALLDGTLTSLLTASIVSVGGPLSELPFVAGGFWHYIPSAADYLPLANVNLENGIIGGDIIAEYKDLALSSITGPCYFAVTMDAIALGRWFKSTNRN